MESRPTDTATTNPDPVFRAPEMRSLVHLVVNAILYATSAHQGPIQLPRDEAKGRRQQRPGRCAGGAARRSHKEYTDDDVYFLPGTIDISSVRRWQELQRNEQGRQVLVRFMVRGHWRRAAASWKDQRLRWIQPYWKGPDLAMIIERDYRLKP